MADNRSERVKLEETSRTSLAKEGAADGNPNEETIEEKRSEDSSLAAGTKRKLDEQENPVHKPKISMSFSGSMKKGSAISMNFGKQGTDKKFKQTSSESLLKKKTGSVAAIFAAEGSDEEEEMPKEAKMRMRNLGKETPTSAGPNSFNKGRQGFTDHLKVWEKKMKLEKPMASKTSNKTS